MTTGNRGTGWRFPPTNGGRVDGFNDPGIAHFSGSPYSSLARETIQNSLDARDSPEQPVHVSFEMIELSPDDMGRAELSAAIDACRREIDSDDPAKPELIRAQDVLARQSIPFLRVSDRNTTGLRGKHWRTLVKMQGASFKADLEGAGGSFGIGKYAPFAVSALRTVFYWTCYEDDGRNFERFQGKCVLMSHQHDGEEVQGTGFYGLRDGCVEMTTSIPDCFRLTMQRSRPILGTSVAIAGFMEAQDWRRRVASSVIENFFYAIDRRQLEVLIEPGDGDADLFQIDDTTLGECFATLLDESPDSEDVQAEGGNSLSQSRAFWEISDADAPAIEKQDQDLGHCRLWIRVGEGLPSRVGFVRRTGMLVTTQQRNLIRFPGFRDFAALCVFEDPAGNELLRRMENPRHDQFEPDRLPEEERRRGRRALNRITDWIRSEVGSQAGPPKGGRSTVLSELATYLPDMQPDEPFEDAGHENGGTGEPGFGERVSLALKPVRRLTPPTLPSVEESVEDGDSDGEDTGGAGGGATGTNEGGGGTGGPGEGEGEGGTGGRGGRQPRVRGVPISGVRILSIPDQENCYRLSFRSDGSAVARLELEEAGDSTTIQRDDIRAVADNVSLDRVSLSEGQRTTVDITADTPIGQRAWRLRAVANDGG